MESEAAKLRRLDGQVSSDADGDQRGERKWNERQEVGQRWDGKDGVGEIRWCPCCERWM